VIVVGREAGATDGATHDGPFEAGRLDGPDADRDVTSVEEPPAEGGPEDVVGEVGVEDAPDATPDAIDDTATEDACTVCGVSCVDTDSDPKNCGACGHDCTPGPCNSGVCGSFTLATSSGGINFLAVFDGTLAWTNYETGAVSSCTVDTCTHPVRVGQHSLRHRMGR
jgi:hypothetical protein